MKKIERLKRIIAPYYGNIGGWRTDRKIVVIESDDWGSIRMPSSEVYEECLNAGYRIEQNPYEKYDSLACEEDLELLFNLLSSFKDQNGNHPIITANVLAANPDFEKIKKDEFEAYHYQLITQTFKEYPAHNRCFELWNEGLSHKTFFPQSHGREHLNVSLFMKALQRGDRDVLFGFERGIPGSTPHGKTGGNIYMEALNYSDEYDKQEKLQILLEGLDLFEELFNYRSKSFIPPTYLWSPDYDSLVSQSGVRYYQGSRRMKEPNLNGNGVKMLSRKLGETNNYGQRYITRNATFEPSHDQQLMSNSVGECLRQTAAAFRMKKPAVICSHRINYVGYLDPKNRDRTLKLLDKLLKETLKRWPDVEFMTSAELGQLLEEND